MSVFICWSGKRSHLLAKAVETLLHSTVPSLSRPDDVFVSDSIKKGVAWFDSILDELNRARAGVVCLTAENVQNPWMHFEAGALARVLSTEGAAARGAAVADAAEVAKPPTKGPEKRGHASVHRTRLFTLLHGLTAADIAGPLGAYQGTSTTRREVGELVRALRLLFDDPIPSDTPIIPDDAWEGFQGALRQVVVPARGLVRDLRDLFQRKTFNEPLHQCADQAWIARYEGARITREHLKPYVELVRTACPTHEQGLFEMLITELDSYGMAIQALLLMPRSFRLADSGELEMDAATRKCCEDRRLAIRSLVSRLLHPLDNPLLPEAVRFMAAETHEERKMIVHRLEGRIRREREDTYEDVFKGSHRRTAVNAAIDRLTRDLLDNAATRDGDAEDGNGEMQDSIASPAPPSEVANAAVPAAGERSSGTNHAPTRLLRFRESSWDLDRIYYYLLVQYFDVDALRWEADGATAASVEAPEGSDAGAAAEDERRAPLAHDYFCAARDVELEIERYRARSKGGSLTPLTYALVALHALKPYDAKGLSSVHATVNSALSLVKEELGDTLRSEPGRPIARLLADIR